MRNRKPLVLGDDATVQQLQRPDDVDVPLAQRVMKLEDKFSQLAAWLAANGIELPDELLEG